MAQKNKKKRKKARHKVSGRPLNTRVRQALDEGRSQRALELAKTLYKRESNPSNKDLLTRAMVSRARELTSQGAYRDVRAILDNAVALCGDDENMLVEIGVLLAACGDVHATLQIAEKITEPDGKTRLQNAIADEAIRQGNSVKQHLPESLHQEYDLIVEAFAASKQGEDETAREKLKGIGLKSPFLEWKLLLRGLLAYYANDDSRAAENWQRLDEKRWPFRLAAPLYFQIDREFASRQDPDSANFLNRQIGKLEQSRIKNALESIRADIGDPKRLRRAFNTAESLRKPLCNEAPELWPRLASCFYWAIILHGEPADMTRYQRVFGTPPDDPKLARLEAFALEMRGHEEGAHHFWGVFEESVANSAYWPPQHKNRIRSLIWHHRGVLANTVHTKRDHLIDDEFDDCYDDIPPTEVKPGSKECFQQAISLAPDRPESYRSLIQTELDEENDKQAIKVARRLLKQCPDDLPTIELLGDLLMKSEHYEEALQFFQRAQEINPLDKDLRLRISLAHLYYGRRLVERGRFDEAREAFQSALNTNDHNEDYPIYCIWAACEFKADNPDKGQELLDRAFAGHDSRLAVVFCILIETIRFKLTKLKTKFNKEFNALLAETPTAEAACELAATSALLRRAGVHYYGQQTHEKKVRSYLQKSLSCKFSPNQYERIIASLRALRIKQLQWDFIVRARQAFPDEPEFYVRQVEYNLDNYMGYGFNWSDRDLLEKASELTDALPRGERRDELLASIEEVRKRLNEMTPFGGIFEGFFGRGGFNPFEELFDPYDDDYEDDEYW